MTREPQDPTRLAAVGASDLEHQLIEAAAAERPSPELTRRMGLALGLSVTAATAAAAAPAAAAVTAKAVAAKSILGWATAGLVTAAVTGGAVGLWVSSRPAARPPVAPMTVTAPAPLTVTAPVPAPAPAEIPAPPPPIPTPRRHAAPAARAGDLSAEIALIDAARTAVRDGAPERALTLLRRYATTYPTGTFRPEATVLRIEALKRTPR